MSYRETDFENRLLFELCAIRRNTASEKKKTKSFILKSHTWRYFTKGNKSSECRALWQQGKSQVPVAVRLWGSDRMTHKRPHQTTEVGKLNNIHILVSVTIHFNAHLLPFCQLANPLQASHHQVHWKTLTNLRSRTLENRN